MFNIYRRMIMDAKPTKPRQCSTHRDIHFKHPGASCDCSRFPAHLQRFRPHRISPDSSRLPGTRMPSSIHQEMLPDVPATAERGPQHLARGSASVQRVKERHRSPNRQNPPIRQTVQCWDSATSSNPPAGFFVMLETGCFS